MDQQNAATVILRAGINKKVGLPNFSSFGAKFDIEIVTDLGILSSPEKLDAIRSKMYGVCFEAVEAQIRLHQDTSCNVPSSQPAREQVKPLPVAPTQTSAFGAWAKSKSDAYGISLPTIINSLYKIVVPHGVATDYRAQGKEMASVWEKDQNSPETRFEEHLRVVFETLENATVA